MANRPRTGVVALALALLLALTSGAVACSGSSAKQATGSTVDRLRPPGPEGSGCLELLHDATAATLAARSLTVDQDAWQERPAGATLSGGGAAVITYQAPNRFHVVPVVAGATGRAGVEQIFVGSQAWQGSAASGWVAYHSRQEVDPLHWLRVPGSATEAGWSRDSCAFSGRVPEGGVAGRAQVDRSGHLATLTMTVTTGRGTVTMTYRVSRVGSSAPVAAPPA